MAAAGASIAGLGLLLALLARPVAGATGPGHNRVEVIDPSHPEASLKNVPLPKFPPPRYNYTIVKKYDSMAISPFSNDPSMDTDIRHVVSTEPCEMFGMIATPDIEHILRELELNGKSYTARVIWYHILDDCAMPLRDIYYEDCDPKQPFGICKKRSLSRWLLSIVDYVVDTSDELNLIMASPPPGAAGQYRRVIRINDKTLFTDFMVTRPEEPCPTSLRTKFGMYGVCATSQEYAAGEIDLSETLSRYHDQPHHIALVYYLFKKRWGTPPAHFPESPTYAKPAPPKRNHESPDAPDMLDADSDRPQSGPPHPDAGPPPDAPEERHPFDDLTPKLQRDDESASGGKSGGRPGVVVAAVAAVLLILALAGASVYFCCLKKRWGVSKLPPVGGIGAPTKYKDVRYERLP
ncbi:envelope glycoprotein D [Equid alphaherpesvirus 3]|uniref:Envelope glycoprotein D n=1 Tax=Equid alphaherpesvirus 3 TaxID=80341 RepID=A0A077B637_9ALPH|nr:envelope glycoprotein D [Equid alphaherpesvirus 3]AIL02990.1 envelope glycoprotein D [Equid alphaherpesvirus 3]